MISALIADVRYSLRGFARRPAFAAIVVLTLAAGIGLNVAVFSLFDQLMLRRLPVNDPAGLVNFIAAGPHIRAVHWKTCHDFAQRSKQ